MRSRIVADAGATLFELAAPDAMVAVYSRDSGLFANVVEAIRTEEIGRASDWSALVQFARIASHAIIVSPSIDEGTLRNLRTIRSASPVTPLVLLTRFDSVNARCLLRACVDDVVWLGEESSMLPGTLRNLNRSLLFCVSEAIREIPSLNPRILHAINFACRSPNPISSVGQLARQLSCSRSSLEHAWRTLLGIGSKPHLHEVLTWLLLLRAVDQWTPEKSWDRVASDLSTYQPVLSRLARRLTGRTLTEITARGKRDLYLAFENRILNVLGPTEASGELSGTLDATEREQGRSPDRSRLRLAGDYPAASLQSAVHQS